ncbi:MAG: tetratricopeptide repeat protein, partial [Candidatus Tectomicrobia bacterium]|nr:tetratricopeptide repeat protein [Candidatus Tectomicrobia bacterium]
GLAYAALARTSYWSGYPSQGIEYGRQAVALLEGTEEWDSQGDAYRVLGLSYYFIGEFELALEAMIQANTIHEQSTINLFTLGFIYATRGDWQEGIEACQRALGRAPEPRRRALALGHLGQAYLEQGDVAQAIPLLEQSVQQLSQFQQKRHQGWYMTYLSEAYLLDGQIDRARELALQALEITRTTKFWYAVGLAQRTLGRIALTRAALPEAETSLKEALGTFTSIEARFELGRTHLDFARLAHAQDDREVLTTHLTKAHFLFRALQVPKYVERAEQLAREFGVPLSQETAFVIG